MPTNNSADSFVDKLAKILGIDAAAVSEKIGALSLDKTMDIISAVTDNDAAKARSLMNMADEPQNVDNETDEAEDIEARTPDDSIPLNDLDRGTDVGSFSQTDLKFNDEVSVNGVRGVVKIPKARGGKIGVLINGKIELVDSVDAPEEAASVTEGMLGLDINRMLALAGMQAATQPMTTVVDNVPAQETPAPATAAPGNIEASNVRDVLSHVCEIERMIPNLRVADASIVRKRLNNLLMKMNESGMPRARKR